MAKFFRRRRYCKFTAEGVVEIDYKIWPRLKLTLPKAAKSFRAGSPARKCITNASLQAP